MDITSPWDHRVYEKKSKKVEKYQDLKKEIWKLWGIRRVEVVPVVVGALGAVNKREDTWLGKLGITINTPGFAAENSFVGNSKDLKEGILESRRRRTNAKDLWPLAMARSLSVMSVQHPPELKHFVDDNNDDNDNNNNSAM